MNKSAHVTVGEESAADPRLLSIVDEISDRIQRGLEVDVEAYIDRLPDQSEYIRQIAQTLECVAGFGKADALAPGSDGERLPHKQIGEFTLIRQIGSGGMGLVFEAQQPSLDRRVALKVLPMAGVLNENQLARFKNEARAAATMHHPHIVPVFAVGSDRGVHYFAMQLIDGPSLAEILQELKPSGLHSAGALAPASNGQPPDSKISAETKNVLQAALSTKGARQPGSYIQKVATWGIQAAEALAYAHENGVLHRDVKPGNLLIDQSGQLWITDFGLARIEKEVSLTMAGDLVGTLRYMSPEQALAKRVLVDHRSDIYSLGLTLYELLALQPAFDGSDRHELLKQIAFEEPKPLRSVDPSIPPELATIIHKSAAKSPEDRYLSGQEMADDLQRFLDNRPIRAKPPTLTERAAKWSRRHLGVVWTAVAASLLLSAVLASATAIVAESRQAAIADQVLAEEQRNNAVLQRNEARLQQYYAEIVSSQTDLADGNLGRLQQKLVRHLPVGEEADNRDWEWYFLFSRTHGEIRTLRAPKPLVFVSWSPDGELFATAGKIWRADTGECVRLFTPSTCLSEVVSWSPNSQTLAWAVTSDDNAIYVWDRRTDEIRDLRGHKLSVWALAFSPNGEQLASGSMDGTVSIWDLATGAVVRSHEVRGYVTDVAWSPDGELVAAGTQGSVLYVWNAATGNELLARDSKGAPQRIRISWRPDGGQLAVNTTTNWYVLDRDDWREVVEHPQRFSGNSNSSGCDIAWSPSGDRLAATNLSTLDIWNAAGEQIIRTLAGHSERINSVSWSPDGDRLATSDGRREIRIWDTRSPIQPPPIDTGAPVERITWSPNGNSLTSVAADDLSITSWQVASGGQIDDVSTKIGSSEEAGVLSPDRRLRAHFSGPNHKESITVRDALTGEVHSIWHGVDDLDPHGFAWSPDSTRLAIAYRLPTSLTLECWDVDNEQRIWQWERYRYKNADYDMHGPSWSPDGSRVAVVAHGDAGDDGNVFWSSHLHVWDSVTGKRILKRPFGNRSRYGGQIEALAWSPDGHYLAQGTTEGFVEILPLSANDTFLLCKARDVPIRAIAWSPNGRRLATAAADGTVKIIEPRQGSELLTFRVEGDGCSLVSWSPDGQKLAAANDAGEIRIWDATRGHEFAAGGNRHSELAWTYYDQADKLHDESQVDYLLQALKLAPQALDYRYLRGHVLARLGRFDEAAREFAAATPERPEQGLWMARWRARALLGARDMDAYRELQASLVDAVRDSQVSSKRLDVAWLGALIPDTTEDFERDVAKWQKSLAAEGPTQEQKNGVKVKIQDGPELILGSMLYRRGRYDYAQQTMTDLVTKLSGSSDAHGQYILACANYLLAMTRHQMGHDFQARRRLKEADSIAQRLEGANANWYWQVELATLHREASAQLRD